MESLNHAPVCGVVSLLFGADNAWLWGLSVAHLAGFLFVVFDCLRHRRRADSALLWIFIAWSLSLVGPVLYLYFGVDRLPSPRHRRIKTDSRLAEALRSREEQAREMPLLYWRHVHEAAKAMPSTDYGRSMARAMNALLPNHPLMAGNRLEPLLTGDEAYPAMLQAIRHARHHIHLQSFIIAPDETGRLFMDALLQKAREGVHVRALFDRFGSTRAVWSGFFRPYRGVPNLQMVSFSQANVFKRQFGINLRNHRKILVVDGFHAFTGGTNIAAENTTRGTALPIHDYHFSVRGPIVQELQYTFLQDWYSMTEETPADLLTDRYFPEIHIQGESMVRLVNNGPVESVEPIASAMFLAVTQARKQILAVTPYFVPTDDILHALKSAALRGVEVHLVVPEQNNHYYAGLASRALYEELLESGVVIHERHPPFSHAKALVVDHIYSLIGSANLDVRSLRLNFETCLAVHDENFAGKMKAIISDDRAQSTPVNLSAWQRRHPAQRLAENAASLLSPML